MTQTRPEPKVIIIPAKEETLQDQKKKKNLRVAPDCFDFELSWVFYWHSLISFLKEKILSMQ